MNSVSLAFDLYSTIESSPFVVKCPLCAPALVLKIENNRSQTHFNNKFKVDPFQINRTLACLIHRKTPGID